MSLISSASPQSIIIIIIIAIIISSSLRLCANGPKKNNNNNNNSNNKDNVYGTSSSFDECRTVDRSPTWAASPPVKTASAHIHHHHFITAQPKS